MNRRVVLIVGCAVVALAACSSSSKSTTSDTGTTTSTPTAPTATTTAPSTPDTQVWLCKPDKVGDPCLSNMTAAVVAPDGTQTVQKTAAATDPKIDCFYVYPTVSKQRTANADLTIDPAEVNVAVAQASRFSKVCRVFAPMYRQGTLASLGRRTDASSVIAFNSARAGWRDYLARYNDGRGVVLIGHSQGSFVLRQLIAKYIDPNPAIRRRIVSAILLGGNVIVPDGKDVGGDFQHIPACRSATQLGCVIAFSSFDETPPRLSLFGRARTPGKQVLCTNPAALAGGVAPLDPYLPARLGGGVTPPDAPEGTPPSWFSYPNLFTGECKNVGGASWLQVTDVRKPGDHRPRLLHTLPPSWGLHLYDGQIALGNLVNVVQSEAAAYH